MTNGSFMLVSEKSKEVPFHDYRSESRFSILRGCFWNEELFLQKNFRASNCACSQSFLSVSLKFFLSSGSEGTSLNPCSTEPLKAFGASPCVSGAFQAREFFVSPESVNVANRRRNLGRNQPTTYARVRCRSISETVCS